MAHADLARTGIRQAFVLFPLQQRSLSNPKGEMGSIALVFFFPCCIIAPETGVVTYSFGGLVMPKVQPIWVINGEADAIVTKLVERNPEILGHVITDQIGVAMATGKDPAEDQDWDAKIEGIKQPEALFSKKTYVVYFYKATWDKYDKRQRAAMIFRQLVRIPEEFDGKLLKEDLHDCRLLVKAFGLDYMTSPKLPDLTEQKVGEQGAQ
jgi:hypothetical protein